MHNSSLAPQECYNWLDPKGFPDEISGKLSPGHSNLPKVTVSNRMQQEMNAIVNELYMIYWKKMLRVLYNILGLTVDTSPLMKKNMLFSLQPKYT